MYIEIPTWNAGEWEVTKFETREEFRDFVTSLFKEPGQYEFDETSNFFNEQSRKFIRDGIYCEYPQNSKDYFKYWGTLRNEDIFSEKSKCRKGVIFKNNGKTWYLSRNYYFWINFLPIYDKLKKTFDFPEIWDAQYHMALYECLAELNYKHVAILKKRQFGSSYFHCGKIINLFWFEAGAVLKMGASLKDYINEKGSWKFLEEYQNFLNSKTEWYRGIVPHKVGTWQQKAIGYQDGKEIFVGNMSTINSYSFDKDDTSGVGGSTALFFMEEAGIAPRMDNTYEFLRPAMSSGMITTGLFIAAGSVGDLNDCKPLKQMMLFPDANDIYSVETDLLDDKGTIGNTALFIPEQWSMPPFIDPFGNSQVKEALEAILEERLKWKKDLSPALYQLRVSQKPVCLEENTFVSANGYHGKIKDYPFIKYDSGFKDVYRVTTKNGHYVDSTLDHKFYIKDIKEYKELKDLKINDKITFLIDTSFNTEIQKVYIDYGVNILKTEIEITKDIAVFLGMFFGDGCLDGKDFNENQNRTYSMSMFFDKQDTSLVSIYKEIIIKYFQPNFYERLVGKNKGGIEIRVTNINLKYIFKAFELYKNVKGGIKRKLEIPSFIFNSPKEIVASFLAGLFETDGYITKRDQRVGYCTSSDYLMSQVCYLLKKFEINPTIKNRTVILEKKSYKQQIMWLTGEESRKFIREIGFLSDRKKELCEIKLKKAKGKKNKNFYDVEEITSIDYIGKKQCYDITTDNHYFSANSIWVHNCIHEAFAFRNESLFPLHLVTKQIKRIEDKEYAIEYVELEKEEGKIKIRRSNRTPITELGNRIKSLEDKEGVIVIHERPHEGFIEWGTYYASIDPVETGRTTTSDSLFSIYIYRVMSEVTVLDQNGNRETRIEPDKIVAWWCGRFDDVKDTNERAEMLIELYNAWTICEANKSSFITHMINKKKQKYLVPRKLLLAFNRDLKGLSEASQEYGWVNSKTIFPHLLSYGIDYLKEVLDTINKPDGTAVKTTYGITRIPDIMLLREMMEYQEGKGNFDRLIAYCSLIAFAKLQQANLGFHRKIEKKELYLENSDKFRNFLLGGNPKPVKKQSISKGGAFRHYR